MSSGISSNAMFKKALVPVDLTETHQQSLDVAARLAAPDGAVVLLHVIEVLHGLSREEEPAFYQRLERKARAHLDHLRRRLEGRAVGVAAEVAFGQRGREVIRFATQEGVDLIVLTSHRVDPTDPGTRWGSLSYQIAFLAPCPVMLVK
jgi:nucleotide-binding universal stress UspA family protein